MRSARSYAGQLTSLIKSKAPKHLQGGIKSSATEEGDGVVRITAKVTGADARAQEYGSGIHAQKGKVGKYPITPKAGKYLAFHWQVHLENAKYLPDGRILLESVQHPGIHPVTKDGQEGYLRPSLKEFRLKLKTGDFPEQIKNAIVSDIRRSFRGNDG